MKTNQKTVIHDSFRFQEFAVSIYLSDQKFDNYKISINKRVDTMYTRIEIITNTIGYTFTALTS